VNRVKRISGGKGNISPTAMNRRDKRKRDHEADEERGLVEGLEVLCLVERGGEGVASEDSCKRNQK
jgi:hypothetical protein